MDKIIPLLQGKWKTQIILEIVRANVLRFGEYKKLLPYITNNVPMAALRNLEAWGLVSRTQYNEMPPRVEYEPTEKERVCCQFAMKLSNGESKTALMVPSEKILCLLATPLNIITNIEMNISANIKTKQLPNTNNCLLN